MLMTLVLAAQVAISPEAMVNAWNERIALLEDMQAATITRFGLDPKKPHLGFLFSTQEFANTTKRLTVVDVVFEGSAAQKAGIRPGDIIAAIGNREMDTETAKAVVLYLSDWPDIVPLTISRGTVRRQVNLRRAPVPCLQTMYKDFPAMQWHERIGKILKLAETAKRELQRSTANPWAPLKSKKVFDELNDITLRAINAMDYDLNPVACSACRIKQ